MGRSPRAFGNTIRSWYFAHDGTVGVLRCGGRAEPVPLETCDRLARTFRFTGGAIPPHPDATEPQDVVLRGFAFTLPANWRVEDPAAVPNSRWVVRSSFLVGRQHPHAWLTVGAFDGDVQTLDRMGDDVLAAATGASPPLKGEATMLGGPAITSRSDFADEPGIRRVLAIQTVRDQRAVTLSCAGDAAAFDTVQQACDTIATSLRWTAD